MNSLRGEGRPSMVSSPLPVNWWCLFLSSFAVTDQGFIPDASHGDIVVSGEVQMPVSNTARSGGSMSEARPRSREKE